MHAWLNEILGPTHLSGGFEIGRALSNATSDSAGVVLDAASRPATTLSGNVTLDWGRATLSAVGGFSLSRNNRGGFGRFAGVFDLVRNREQLPLVQFGADYTAVRSPFVPGLMSSGATIRIGNPRVLQSGVRLGGRWRASTYTPVTAIDVSRAMVWWLPGNSVLSAQLSATGVFTKAPRTRLQPSETPPLLVTTSSWKRERATLGDMALNLQMARGSWAVGGRVVRRIGRSAAVWDDPVPTQGYMRQATDGHAAAVGRLIWAPFDNLMIAAEGGRQLSDPILGVSGVRYASISVRMNFEAGQRRTLWFERQQFNRTAEVLADLSSRHDALVSRMIPGSNGQRLLALHDVPGDSVEVAGDFTQWKPVALTRCQVDKVEKWCGYFSLPPGVYHLLYRSDGGEWQIPPGLTAVDDSFGGSVGLLIIP